MAQQQSVDPVTEFARNFVHNYYGTLDRIENRPNLAGVYRDSTKMKFGDDSFVGTEAIMGKLMGLPSNMARIYSAVDAVPIGNYVLVNVMGQQKTDQENDHPLAFTHTFVLSQEGTNIVIMTEIFRLVLHDV